MVLSVCHNSVFVARYKRKLQEMLEDEDEGGGMGLGAASKQMRMEAMSSDPAVPLGTSP